MTKIDMSRRSFLGTAAAATTAAALGRRDGAVHLEDIPAKVGHGSRRRLFWVAAAPA